jgi:hypothetical protein
MIVVRRYRLRMMMRNEIRERIFLNTYTTSQALRRLYLMKDQTSGGVCLPNVLLTSIPEPIPYLRSV